MRKTKVKKMMEKIRVTSVAVVVETDKRRILAERRVKGAINLFQLMHGLAGELNQKLKKGPPIK